MSTEATTCRPPKTGALMFRWSGMHRVTRSFTVTASGGQTALPVMLAVQLDGVPHFLLAAILSYEFGIGVRNGCFCAHPYMLHLLIVAEEEAIQVRQYILNGDRREVPGLVRISFGLYNRVEEVDQLVEALEKVARGEIQGQYVQDTASGDFKPLGWNVCYEDYFSVEKFVHGGIQ